MPSAEKLNEHLKTKKHKLDLEGASPVNEIEAAIHTLIQGEANEVEFDNFFMFTEPKNGNINEVNLILDGTQYVSSYINRNNSLPKGANTSAYRFDTIAETLWFQITEHLNNNYKPMHKVYYEG